MLHLLLTRSLWHVLYFVAVLYDYDIQREIPINLR